VKAQNLIFSTGPNEYITQILGVIGVLFFYLLRMRQVDRTLIEHIFLAYVIMTLMIFWPHMMKEILYD
jgi:hypothetical protein